MEITDILRFNDTEKESYICGVPIKDAIELLSVYKLQCSKPTPDYVIGFRDGVKEVMREYEEAKARAVSYVFFNDFRHETFDEFKSDMKRKQNNESK